MDNKDASIKLSGGFNAMLKCTLCNKNITIKFYFSCFFAIEAKFVQICILCGVFFPFAVRLCLFSVQKN